MNLTNRDGTPVDPVPFIVVSLLGALILISWGPLYLREHGLPLDAAIAASVGLSFVVVGVAYHRYVRTANPTAREEVPAARRYLRLVYGVVIGVVVLLALVGLLYVR